MGATAKKKALVLSPILTTVGVDKKVPEIHKYGSSDRSVFGSEKEKV